jgi:predicted nuclease of restriction endonuclease-like (RecB) superfamily
MKSIPSSTHLKQTSQSISHDYLEKTLIQHLADFLLKLGDDFAFVGRLRKLRINDSWFRVDCCFSTAASSAR